MRLSNSITVVFYEEREDVVDMVTCPYIYRKVTKRVKEILQTPA